MRENFDRWLKEVLRHEGSYVDHPQDPGGATNMGITQKTLAAWRGKQVSKDDVRRLGLIEVGAIYRDRYWDEVKADTLPTGLDLIAFDAAVNSGPSRGTKWLQTALYVRADGEVGPNTIKAAKQANVRDAIIRACEARMAFLKGLETWPVFGKGWTRRVDGVRITAIQAALGPTTTPATTPATSSKEIYPMPLPKTPELPPSGHSMAWIGALFVAAMAAIYYWLTKGPTP